MTCESAAPSSSSAPISTAWPRFSVAFKGASSPTRPSHLCFYGSSDLSRKAIAFRRSNKISPDRDVGAIEYRAADNSPQTIVVASNPRHVEHALRRRLQELNVDPSMVTRLYSDLQPCTLPIVNCQRLIGRYFPQAEVTWSFEYGASENSRRRGMDALSRAIRNLDQYQLRLD